MKSYFLIWTLKLVLTKLNIFSVEIEINMWDADIIDF